MTPAFRQRSVATLAAILCFASLPSAAADKPAATPKAVADAVADPARPQADRDRDADRKPAECIAFAGLKPGFGAGPLTGNPFVDPWILWIWVVLAAVLGSVLGWFNILITFPKKETVE